MAEQSDNIIYDEEFIVSPRGVKLFTCRWLPSTEPKALIFLCHGYAMECRMSMKETALRLVKADFAVYGIDYEGHGKSSGLQGLVQSFDGLVDDCSDHFIKICERQENKKKQRFLFGESMGGAVLLHLHMKNPNFYWNGAILVAPMCKIADEMKPHPLVLTILTKFSNIIPTWKIVITQDIIDVAFKSPEIRKQIRNNPYCYKGRPRLKTGTELLRVSLDIEKNLHKVSLPFLIVHGGDDRVTDPAVSELLYDKSSSDDKTFKLYPGMWHGLTSAEPIENIDLVFTDILAWLDKRSISPEARQEMEWKAKHEEHSLSHKK